MPAVSKKQQRFFGMVRAAQKGDMKNPSKEVSDVANDISNKDAKKFAKTKHEGLPEKKKMNEDKVLKKIAKQLDGASKMHKSQANKVRKHIKDMHTEAKKPKNCGCGQDPCITYGKKEKVDEACWKGYTQKGMKKKGKKVVPNCVPVGEAKEEQGRSDYGKASVRNKRKFGKEGEPAIFDASGERGKMIDKRRAEHKAKRGVKEEVVTEADKKGKGSGKKDACYKKVKASAKVWPSAYASGRLVQCRKKGAANYGNSKSESYSWRDDVTEGSLHKWFKGSKSKDGKGGWVNVVTGGTCASDEPGEGTPKCVSSSKRASMSKAERASASRRKKAADPGQQSKSGAAKPTYVSTDKPKKKKVNEAAAWTKKSGKNPSGGLNEKGRKSYERENPGSDLKSPSKKVGNKRRASFCARMKGMKKKLTSAKTARDPDSRINKSLRAWNCEHELNGNAINEDVGYKAFIKQAQDARAKVKKKGEEKKEKDAQFVDTKKHGVKFYDKKGSGRIVKGKKIYS